MTHTLPFFLRVSTSPQCMYVELYILQFEIQTTGLKPNQKVIGNWDKSTATEKNLWIIEWNRYLGFSPSLDVWI